MQRAKQIEYARQRKHGDFASSSFSRGSAGTRRSLQDAACDFGGKLRDGSFDVAASSREFSRDAHFRGADFACGFRARILDLCGALIEKFFARGLLLGIQPTARLLEGFLILLDLLGSSSLRRLRSLLRARAARIPLGHHLKQGLEEKYPSHAVK